MAAVDCVIFPTPPKLKTLSVIIVNYNVRFFLEQCLLSVLQAMEGINGEVIVVDNHSQDGSVEMVQQRFGQAVTLIANTHNPGFAKANNQGLERAQGRYVLLLNPDTLVEEHCFRRCIDFMEAHPEAGALGVQMIDGNGRFLPESKRALPTPAVSFYKIFGLARLFPRNKTFGQYHLTYLDKEQNHEVEILSGAFMFMRKAVLEQTGYLDESFFMYGEDIDLSYRIRLAGYKNYYLADTCIIHYKGESTKKGSLNYVRVFYQAMIIFAKKHFGGGQRRLFIWAIRLAVYFRALLAVGHRLIQRLGFPLLEAGLIYAGMFGIKAYWEHYVKYIVGGKFYPDLFTYGYMPVYTLVFVGCLWLAGAYRRPYKLRPLVVAPLGAFVAIATVTYMFPFVLNFSRAIVGLSAVFTMLLALLTRGLIHRWRQGSFFFTDSNSRRAVITGSPAGIADALEVLRQAQAYPLDLVGAVSEQALPAQLPARLGRPSQLERLLELYQVREVIFAHKDLPTSRLLHWIKGLHRQEVEIKILPPGASFLLGPKQVVQAGANEYMAYALQRAGARRSKRALELLLASLLLLLFPLNFWAYRAPMSALRGLWQVLAGKRQLVGYVQPAAGLPPLRPALLNMLHRAGLHSPPQGIDLQALDRYYARHWQWELDGEILWKAWTRLGS